MAKTGEFWLRVPGTIPSHCTDRVLTMERLGGVPLDEFLETADRKARDPTGEISLVVGVQA